MENAQTPVKPKTTQAKSSWYLRYLPFIAKPLDMQVEWLRGECKKNKLAKDELLPYVRLLFSLDSEGERARLKQMLAELDSDVVHRMLDAADIYSVARVIDLIPELNDRLTEVILLKEMPQYEQKPQKIMDEVFYAINQCAGGVLEKVATTLIEEGRVSKGFKRNYKRFMAILEDEEFIRNHWPSVK